MRLVLTDSGRADRMRAMGAIAAATNLPTIHHLATDLEPFAALWDGRKTHEVRRLDGRTFREGDRLILSEREAESRMVTGRVLWLHVTHVTRPGSYGLPADVAVMSVVEVDRAALFRVPGAAARRRK